MYQYLEYHLMQAGCGEEVALLKRDIRWYVAKCGAVGFLDLEDRLMSHNLAQRLYKDDRSELLKVVRQKLLSREWSQSACDLLLETTVRFLITDDHRKEFTDFQFINDSCLMPSYERLMLRYGQNVPYLVDVDEAEGLSEATLCRLTDIAIGEEIPTVARRQAVAKLARGLKRCDEHDRESLLVKLINYCLDHWSIPEADQRVSEILCACEFQDDVFTQFVGCLNDGWPKEQYELFVGVFKKLYNSTQLKLPLHIFQDYGAPLVNPTAMLLPSVSFVLLPPILRRHSMWNTC